MSDNNHQNISTTNGSNPGDALRVFATHVKQMLLSLPPVSMFTLIAPWILLVLDNVLIYFYSHSISQWLYLDAEKVVSGFQGKIKQVEKVKISYNFPFP